MREEKKKKIPENLFAPSFGTRRLQQTFKSRYRNYILGTIKSLNKLHKNITIEVRV